MKVSYMKMMMNDNNNDSNQETHNMHHDITPSQKKAMNEIASRTRHGYMNPDWLDKRSLAALQRRGYVDTHPNGLLVRLSDEGKAALGAMPAEAQDDTEQVGVWTVLVKPRHRSPQVKHYHNPDVARKAFNAAGHDVRDADVYLFNTEGKLDSSITLC